MAGLGDAIVRKDRRELVRDNRLLIAVAFVILLSLVAVAASWVRVADHARDRAAATATEQESWLGQGPRDPHSAAHFAQWTFRPVAGVALLDPGATPYTGSATWLEAHARNPSAFRPVEDRATTLDLGEFSPAWVLQTVGPLLAFLLAAGLVARERERGTLRLMIASGASPTALVSAKSRGLVVTLLLVAAPAIAAAVAALALSPSALSPDQMIRAVLWVVVHLLWLALAVILGVLVSARSRGTATALVTLIALWAVAVPLGPRAVASLAEALHPTPSGARFWAEAQTEIREGFDGSGAQAERTAALQTALLAQYGVARVEDLPISFRGASLDANERFGNRVFARRFERLDAIHEQQRAVMRLGAVLAPTIALQNVSAALAGTDNRHIRAFDDQAEVERQRLVNTLNADLIRNSAGDPAYRADADLWARFPPFEARPLAVMTAIRGVWPDLLILLGWLVGSVLLLRLAGRRLSGELAQ